MPFVAAPPVLSLPNGLRRGSVGTGSRAATLEPALLLSILTRIPVFESCIFKSQPTNSTFIAEIWSTALALHRCEMVFKNTDAAVYAPSAHTSFHRHMHPRPGLGLQRVTYTDGFCFAVRTNLLTRACADFSGCRYGFGVDLHLGMLARQHLRPVLIDHNYHARHPTGAGYSVQKATEEWEKWQRRQPLRTLLFHKLAKKRFSKTSFGMKLLLAIPW